MIAVCVPVVVTADEGLGAATKVTEVFVSVFTVVFAVLAAATDIFANSSVSAAATDVFALLVAATDVFTVVSSGLDGAFSGSPVRSMILTSSFSSSLSSDDESARSPYNRSSRWFAICEDGAKQSISSDEKESEFGEAVGVSISIGTD